MRKGIDMLHSDAGAGSGNRAARRLLSSHGSI
jgi:hypothetical protein